MNKALAPAQPQFAPVPTSYLLQRKCSCGSHTVAGGECAECASKKNKLQRKLRIGSVNDPLEQEADRVADQVMARPLGHAVPHIQRFSKAGADQEGEVPDSVSRTLGGSGAPLDAAICDEMSSRFGHDFSHVRVHRSVLAEESARDVNAKAYTVGSNIAFGAEEYAPQSNSGRRLIAHELAHVLQQGGNVERLQRQPVQQSLRDRICYDTGSVPQNRQPSDCDAPEPENCNIYEQWLATFQRLQSFISRDTAPGGATPTSMEVLGQRASRPIDDPNALADQRPVLAVNERASDGFIDHPTDQWVSTCLPGNLLETAYRLPSDCADIAVILRHVWLSAHRRTETYGSWTVGDTAGGARRRDVGKIIGEVFTGNVAAMVNPYANANGQPLRTFSELGDLLHPGDILVWEHHSGGLGTRRSGGHTQTIVDITRKNGRIIEISVLQGNQPISLPQAQEIRSHVGSGAPEEQTLRDAPGRRIEVDSMSSSDLRDLELPARRGQAAASIWTWADGHTTLVVAGPSSAAPRPAMRNIGRQRIRRISDWFALITNTPQSQLQGTFEAALLELRAMVEAGQTGLGADATGLGRTAGERLWTIARAAGRSRGGDLADETHFRPLQRMRATIQALGDPTGIGQVASAATPLSATVRTIFGLIDAAFHLAARGVSTIAFPRRRPGQVRVLVTGFDPFNATGPVPAGTVNPSGAAVLALDNSTIRMGHTTINVEGVVLPVNFSDFSAGMVENIIRPLVQNRDVDAILTVSLDASIAPNDPVRIERFVVGVHEDRSTLGAVPSASSGGIGPAIIETQAPIDDIARETSRPGRRNSPAIPQPAFGNDITLSFASASVADQALISLGLLPQGAREVTIDDLTALRAIIATMRRAANGTDLTFTSGGRGYTATVLSGPGGNFLSNEVSYRTLRLLAAANRTDLPSFHVHVQRPLQGGGTIPQDASTRTARTARSQAISEAIATRNRLIATIENMIRAIASRITP